MKFPKIMGILNVTPDSFSDGGEYLSVSQALQRVEAMVQAGVDIVDIGGESTRPGAVPVPVSEELQRVMPVIEAIQVRFPEVQLSIDTTKYEVARQALDRGVRLVNDVSGLQFEPRLASLVAQYGAGLIIMHMQGTPQTMQQNPHYTDVVDEVYQFLQKQIQLAKTAGVEEIYADVGIGFGKMLGHNLELLRRLSDFQSLGVPMVLGISRKSMFRQLLGIESPKERDVPTLITHLLLLCKSSPVAIVRVHNVELFAMARRLWTVFNNALEDAV